MPPAGCLRLWLDPQPDGNGAVVGQADVHMGAEPTGRYLRVQFARARRKILKKRLPYLGRGGRRETGPGAFSGVGRQRELRHQQ